MPDLPISGVCPLDGGILPVRSTDDVLALLPLKMRTPPSAIVRDALISALTEILREYQRRSRRAVALSDVLRATGDQLDGLLGDHEVFRQPGEKDEDYRARFLLAPALVTPSAILSGVNAILAKGTPKTARYFESELDQWFVSDGTATWDSFVFDGVTMATPHYQDRLFSDDTTENGGAVRPSAEVLGAWCSTGDQVGRYFILRIPPLEAVDDDGSYATDAIDDGMFIADGSDTSGAESDGSDTSFFFTDQVFSDDLYAAIVSMVETLKGQGIRWQAYVDPLL